MTAGAIDRFSPSGAPNRNKSMAVRAIVGGCLVLVVVGLAFVAPPAAGLGLLVLLALATAVARSRRDAAAVMSLMVFLLMLIPERYVIVGPLKSVGYPAMLAGLFALVVWVVCRFLGMIPRKPGHPIHWLMGGYLLSVTAGYAAGTVRALTPIEAAGSTRVIFPILACLGIALLTNDAIGTRQRLDTLLQRTVVIGAFAAFIGIVEFAFKTFTYTTFLKIPGLEVNGQIEDDVRASFTRVMAASAHPIEYSVAIGCILPIALHYARYAPTLSLRRRYKLCSLVLACVLPLTVSRSAVLALAVGVVVYAVEWNWRERLNLMVLTIVGLGAFRAAVPGLIGTLRSLFLNTSNDPSIKGRTEDYAKIPGLLEHHWLFGRGIGTFQPSQYFFLDNQYLGSLLQAGVIGFVALVALFVVGISLARGARKVSVSQSTRSLGQAIAAAIAVLTVCAFTFDELGFKQTQFLLFLFCGCAGALWSMTRTASPPGVRRTPDVAANGDVRQLMVLRQHVVLRSIGDRESPTGRE